MFINLNIKVQDSKYNFHFYNEELDEDNGIILDKENTSECIEMSRQLPDEVLEAVVVLQNYITTL